MNENSNQKAGVVPLNRIIPPANEKPEVNGSSWQIIGICVFLAVIVWAVFGQTVHYEFVNYDDDEQIYEHPVIKNGLSLQGIVWVFTHSDDGHWIPLNKISHMLDCQFYGLKPGGHHLTNVLLHAATAIFLFLVLRRMTGLRANNSPRSSPSSPPEDTGSKTTAETASARPAGDALWRSAFVAAVFAVHPLRVESVAWVAERKDVLSGLFFMLALWAYVRYVQKTETRDQQLSLQTLSQSCKPRASVDYWLALLFFGCGLMSKAMVATLPLVLLLLDYWPLHRFLRPEPVAAEEKNKRLSVSKRLILEKIPFLGVIIAVGMGLLFSRDRNGVMVAVALQSGQRLVHHNDLSSVARTGGALLTPLVYLKQLFFPAGLVVFSPPGQSVTRSGIFISAVILLAISVMVWLQRRKRPCLMVGWFWYLVMLAPILFLIQKGAEFRCDRYTYLPQIGLYLMLTWWVAELSSNWRYRRWILSGGSAIVLIALLFCARAQTSYWRNSESLWTHTLACTSDNALAHNNLGSALLNEGRVDDAIVQFQKALQIEPEVASLHYNLANAFVRDGRLDEAITHYRRALQIDPGYRAAGKNLNFALSLKEKANEALTRYQKALQTQPDSPDVLNNLAWLLATCPDASRRDGVQAVKYARPRLRVDTLWSDWPRRHPGGRLRRGGTI